MSKAITITQMVRDNLGTLNHVTAELINGVVEENLIRRYQGQFIVPGVNIRRHLLELHAGGCLYRKGNKVFLRDSCNPIKLLELT